MLVRCELHWPQAKKGAARVLATATLARPELRSAEQRSARWTVFAGTPHSDTAAAGCREVHAGRVHPPAYCTAAHARRAIARDGAVAQPEPAARIRPRR